jgi:glutamyl/glutaminyl-tRNA synthetase
MTATPLVTRFAPSPTGHLHIGGARTALFCWAFAKKQGGRFMIRIEDTDQARSSEESARGILEDLAWLGIDWDDGPVLKTADGRVIGGDARGVGPYFQAQRVALYNKYILQLVEQGKAYPAFETPQELEAKRKEATAKKQTFRYDRAAYHALPTPAQRLARMKESDAGGGGKPYVIRFYLPDEEIVVHDAVLGDVRYAAGEGDDFVIRKADGFPTYHFAVVVDDETMGVTHILRAQEHLNNTPRHVALQKALGFRTPVYGHMPLIFNMDGTKMSKRDKAKTARAAAKEAMRKDAALTADRLAAEAGLTPAALGEFLAAKSDSVDIAEAVARRFGAALPEIEVYDFRAAGYLPEAITNFIALLGWSPGGDLEKFDSAYLASHFDLDRIGKTNARFDRVKLLSFNGDYIGAMSDERFLERWRAWCGEYAPEAAGVLEGMDSGRRLMLAKAVKPRAKTLRDALKSAAFALTPDDAIQLDPKAVEKFLVKAEPSGRDILGEVGPMLRALEPFEPASIDAAIKSLAERRGTGQGSVAQPLRVALTGTSVSPPVGETAAILGRDSTLRRIERCMAALSGPA